MPRPARDARHRRRLLVPSWLPQLRPRRCGRKCLGRSGHPTARFRDMTTWIRRFDQPASVPAGRIRVAVKDAIDVAGVITTAGCIAVRDRAVPASADAACLAGLRAAGADLVGKTTLTELCLSP